MTGQEFLNYLMNIREPHRYIMIILQTTWPTANLHDFGTKSRFNFGILILQTSLNHLVYSIILYFLVPFEACEVSYMYYHILNNYYIYTILYACPAVDLHVYMCSCFHTRTLTEFWTYVPLSEVITRYYEYLDRILYLWILCVCVCVRSLFLNVLPFFPSFSQA